MKTAKTRKKNKLFLKILSSHYAIHAYMIWLFGGEKVFKFKSYRFLPILVQYTNFYTFFSSFVKRSSSTYFINLFRGVTPFPTKNINFRFFKTNNFQVFSNHNVFVLKYLLHFKFRLFECIERCSKLIQFQYHCRLLHLSKNLYEHFFRHFDKCVEWIVKVLKINVHVKQTWFLWK